MSRLKRPKKKFLIFQFINKLILVDFHPPNPDIVYKVDYKLFGTKILFAIVLLNTLDPSAASAFPIVLFLYRFCPRPRVSTKIPTHNKA